MVTPEKTNLSTSNIGITPLKTLTLDASAASNNQKSGEKKRKHSDGKKTPVKKFRVGELMV
jgi:hypothetical protein